MPLPDKRLQALKTAGPRASAMSKHRSYFLASTALAALLLGGCHKLPPCYQAKKAILRPAPKPAQQLLIGIDGSGSMLGHVQAADRGTWETMLQAVKTTAAGMSGVAVDTYRIGGGTAQQLGSNTTMAANETCFFKGCGIYPSVASSLQTLWEIEAAPKKVPLRLLITDLEVNGEDITSLIKAVGQDLDQGASVGILALKIPFNGDVYNAKAQKIFNGSLNRPLYLLTTGSSRQVKELLSGIRQKMSLSGVDTPELSVIDAQAFPEPLTVAKPNGEPGTLKLQRHDYNSRRNSEYVFARLSSRSPSVILSSLYPWPEGTKPEGFMLANVERIPIPPKTAPTDPGSIALKSVSLHDSHLRMELAIPSTVEPGLLRATIPAGSLPEPWWISWNRGGPQGADAKEKTDGLLQLMLILSQKVRDVPNAPPAASFCLAFEFDKSN
jgi:hypothetical protein